jgi:uncharacterized protein
MTSAEVIDEIGVRLAAAVPPDSQVVLFGSHARGDADAGSDYDVLVVEPRVASPARESVRLRRTLRGLGVPIDVIVVDAEKARRRATVRGTMIEQALREGRVLAQL